MVISDVVEGAAVKLVVVRARTLTGATDEEARDFFVIELLLTCLGAMRVIGRLQCRC
jgi:hypothetical protein